MSLYDEQLAKMKRLMSSGNINENKISHTKNIVEYHALGADGKTYGIVKEGLKYYIKTAPKKNTEVLAEDYDYIGGFMNKKQYEYNSYAKASKDLELKLMNLNEAYAKKEPIVEAFDPYKKMDVLIEQTDAMKSEIERQRQIMKNTSIILKEESKISTTNVGVPEAPKTAASPASQGAPFTEKATAKLDKDSVKKSENYKKQAPFTKDGEVTDADMESDKNPKGGDSKDTEAAKYVPSNSVANQHPKGGKVAKVNEGKKRVKMTEEQVLAWTDNENYLDTSTGTTIGDSAPFDKTVGCKENQPKENCSNESDSDSLDEEIAMWQQGDNINSPTPGNGEVGDTAPFDETVKEEQGDAMNAGVKNGNPYVNKKKNPNNKTNIDTDPKEGDKFKMKEDLEHDLASNYAGFDGDEDIYNDNNLDFEQQWQQWLDDGGANEFDRPNGEFMNEPSLDDEVPTRMEYDPTYGMDNPYESKKPKGKAIKEDKLDVFGKTPGYRKKPMTLPANTEVAPNGAEDWNDDSVKGEKPFGQQIGSSAPYTEIVQQITNAVVTAITNMNMDKKKNKPVQ